ncbi:hypothetical protein [Luteimonas viscosa]|nr:hypothetical protein [Luteimonas viscosa]
MRADEPGTAEAPSVIAMGRTAGGSRVRFAYPGYGLARSAEEIEAFMAAR